jgi:hypothetical protein
MSAVTEVGLEVALSNGPIVAINNSAQVTLAALAYELQGQAQINVCEESFEDKGQRFAAGSLLITNSDSEKLKAVLKRLDLSAVTLAAMPVVKSHPAATPRIAFMHTWISTQTEGWWRYAFDSLHVPFSYISTQNVAAESNLRAKYDVIVFAPVGGAGSEQIVNGLPMWGNAMPWKKSEVTPNLATLDSTDDIRPGLGESGVTHLKEFVKAGGLLITSEDTSEFAIEQGMTPGVFVTPKKTLKVEGSVLNSVVLNNTLPVSYGYESNLPVYSADGLAFTVGNLTINRNILTAKEYKRPTGRGGPEDEDIPEGRMTEKAPALPAPKAWEATPLNEEQQRNNPYLIPAEYRPKVILHYAAGKELLLSGLLENSDSIAEHAVVVQAHYGQGNVLLFGNNPVYRGETIGSYALVFNSIMNFGHLQ